MPSSKLMPTSIVIVERNGDLRAAHIDAYTPTELRKKCKCTPSSKFEMHAEWAYSGFECAANDNDRFVVELWSCDDGNAGQENKYEFPPPVDTILFFGACALVAKDMTPQHRVIPLTLEKWDKMYNFLFGGFDTLANCDDDDNEEDELDLIPASRKTKDGYLKDGFVVDNSSYETDEDESGEDESDEDEDEDEDESDDEDADADDDDADDEDATEGECATKPKKTISSTAKNKPSSKRRDKKQPKEEILVETLSELSEEAYEYSDDC